MQKQILYQKGYIQDKIPEHLYQELLASINIKDRVFKQNHSNKLVGSIEEEKTVTSLIPANFYQYLASLANEYCKNFNVQYMDLTDESLNKEFVFIESWLNYQKKHEFNPVHIHSGNLSYVVWIKIPYDLNEELSLPNVKESTDPSNSLFAFVGQDFLHSIKVSKEFEGTIVMFDSTQQHVVYPFYTSDEYRISMSGNLNVNKVA